MLKLELLPQFKKKFGKKLNPDIKSIKYCQSEDIVAMEIYIKNAIDDRAMIDLSFIGTSKSTYPNGEDYIFTPLFSPKADIIDNARELLKLNEESLYICEENFFNKELTIKHQKQFGHYRYSEP